MSTVIVAAKSRITAPSILGDVAFDYDFMAAATMTQSTAGTGAAPGNGDPVGFVNDQSGNGYHIAAASNGERPLYQTGVHNGQAAVLFDGTNDSLARLTTSNVSANRAALTIYAVVKHAAAPTTRESYVLLTTGANTTARLEHGASLASADRLRIVARRANADTSTTINGSIAVGTGMTIGTAVVNYAGDTMVLYTNEQQAATGTPPGTSGASTENTNGRIYVGGAGAGFLQGHYFRLVAFWAAHNAQQQRLMWDFLRRACHV